MSYVILSGGVGGAKLVQGFANLLPNDQVAVIANTGDDFVHLGLPVSPDLDTLMYTLAGIANPATGWGLANETYRFMESLKALGGEDWFTLGDGDIATHIRRKQLLDDGADLYEATTVLREQLNVAVDLIPMSNDSVATLVHSDEGVLGFQDYFVRRQAGPKVEKLVYSGSDSANATPAALQALQQDSLEAVVITPSNPYLSIDPILSLRDIRAALEDTNTPVIAVSPVVGGKALKGPTAKIMAELGIDCSVLSIAEHYRGLIDGLIIDEADAGYRDQLEATGIAIEVAPTVMTSLAVKTQLAKTVAEFAARLTET